MGFSRLSRVAKGAGTNLGLSRRKERSECRLRVSVGITIHTDLDRAIHGFLLDLDFHFVHRSRLSRQVLNWYTLGFISFILRQVLKTWILELNR